MKNRFILILAAFTYNYSGITLLPYCDSETSLQFIKNTGILPDNPVIVDAGAYDGKESLMMATRFWPNGNVYAFEPVPDIYERLKKTIARASNITPVNLALSDKNGFAEFYLSYESDTPGQTSMSSSLLKPKDHLLYAATRFGQSIKVRTSTLDDWAKENNIEKIDFLWLDLQGFELPVLKSSPNIISKAKAIYLEVEFVEAYEGQPKYEEIKNWLESQGFVMIAKTFRHPMELSDWGSTLWFGDVLFIKKN